MCCFEEAGVSECVASKRIAGGVAGVWWTEGSGVLCVSLRMGVCLWCTALMTPITHTIVSSFQLHTQYLLLRVRQEQDTHTHTQVCPLTHTLMFVKPFSDTQHPIQCRTSPPRAAAFPCPTSLISSPRCVHAHSQSHLHARWGGRIVWVSLLI